MTRTRTRTHTHTHTDTPIPAGAPRQAWLPLRGQAAPVALMLLPPPFWVTVDSTQHAKLRRLEEFYKFLQRVNLTLRGQVKPSGNRISSLHPESTRLTLLEFWRVRGVLARGQLFVKRPHVLEALLPHPGLQFDNTRLQFNNPKGITE